MSHAIEVCERYAVPSSERVSADKLLAVAKSSWSGLGLRDKRYISCVAKATHSKRKKQIEMALANGRRLMVMVAMKFEGIAQGWYRRAALKDAR